MTTKMRPLRFLLYTFMTILLAFLVALALPSDAPAWLSFFNLLVVLGIFIFTLLTYFSCIIEKDGETLLFLLGLVSIAFAVSAALWFTFPETARLEPLSTLLALDAAFLGYLSSTSGQGQLRVGMHPDGEDTLQVNLTIDFSNEDDAQESATADG